MAKGIVLAVYYNYNMTHKMNTLFNPVTSQEHIIKKFVLALTADFGYCQSYNTPGCADKTNIAR